MGNISNPSFVPTPFMLHDYDLLAGGTAALAANTVYLVGMTLYAGVTLTNIRVRCVVGGSGHYDVGLYDSAGTNKGPNNLLAHAAATATSLATSSGNLNPALIGGNIPLAPGNYWLALWVDNATDTFLRTALNAGVLIAQSGGSSGPLPVLASSLTGLGDTGTQPFITGLLLGSFS